MFQIFIFRRDLRIHDNNTLNQLSQFPEPIIPIFIFDPVQISPQKNTYFSNNCVQFMCESIQDLSIDISNHKGKLQIFHGEPTQILKKLLKYNIKRIGFNKDYTQFSINRDNNIQSFCQQNNIEFISLDDTPIFPIGTIKTNNNTPYKKFTPFYNKALKLKIPTPHTNKINFANLSISNININKYYKNNPNLLHKGGRTNALLQLQNIPDDYKNTHDIPSIPTTEMSAYNKFGCISIREFLLKVKNHTAIARQLYFRDFYYNAYALIPNLFSNTSDPKFLKIKWNKPKQNLINAFYNGHTGFPIIDAGIRQMLTTGFMHNRVRMLAASFFSKDLLYNWKIGEKFFAQNLYDYDPIQNNAGWQTVAGTGVSALEWFRVMNPWTQTLKFDPQCIYIKEWIPELRNVDNKIILNWEYEQPISSYPKPIVNHSQRRDIMLKTFKKALK